MVVGMRSLAAIAVLVAACGDDASPAPPAATCTPIAGSRVTVQTVIGADRQAENLDAPLLVTAPAGDPRLFVVERPGRIRIFADGVLQPRAAPFLDVSDRITAGDERGLLGLAFHPGYASNGRFFVYYTTVDEPTPGADVVAEFRVSASDANRADPTSERVLLSIPDRQNNHNGGMIEIGPDGQLWIGTGDEGGGGDDHGPIGNAQSSDSLHGKILRLDVDAEDPQPVIWARGLRNPWRWSFDTKTRDLYIGDVGQGEWEEIDVVPTSEGGGVNFGWRLFEGDRTYPDQGDGGARDGMTFPAVVHGNRTDGWNSIIGGQVYRGACFPDLDGVYFYSDANKSELWSFRWQAGQVSEHQRVLARGDFVQAPTSIHSDGFGELYITDLNGQVSRIVAAP
jgi:glucose/arabinose dehydrogenase